VCGHYEGIDERRSSPSTEPRSYSLGDFVLTGGEIPALAFVDATVRLVDGAIAPDSLASESFTGQPSSTRRPIPGPRFSRGAPVPEVLLSGDHAKIAAWRRDESAAADDR